MVQKVDMMITTYMASRKMALKQLLKQMRQDAHLSQADVANFLGCSRTRITENEREDGSDYSVGEIELLAVLFGRHPLDLLRMTGQNAIEVGEIMTEKYTGKALLQVIDCEVPQPLLQVLTRDEMPGGIVFSPTGQTMASIIDSYMMEDWQEEEPYQATLLCWETQSGRIIDQIRLPYAEKIAPLENGQVVITTYQLFPDFQQTLEHQGSSHLLIWNTRSSTDVQKFPLLDQVQELAVSPDGRLLAAYMPATTTIQVWQTQDFQPVGAFELNVDLSASHPGGTFFSAIQCQDLPCERKYSALMLTYRSSQFEFLTNKILVIGFPEGNVEIDVGSRSDGSASSPFGPRSDYPRVTYARNEQQEITVRSLEYEYHPGAGESKVQLRYQLQKKPLYPPDAEVSVTKHFSGTIRQPVILDHDCILAWVSYDTPYRWGRVYKRRIGLVNLISGKVVMLTDQNRFLPGDNQMYACIAPYGNIVAYWAFPYEQEPRLALQHITLTPLKNKESSLQKELTKSQKQRAESDAYMLLHEEKDSI